MHLRHLRYISLAAPAVFMLAAVLAFQGPRWLGHIACAILFVTSLVYWREAYVPEEPVDWSGYGQLVEQHVKPGETLLFYPGLSPRWHIEIFYLGAAHYSHAFPRPIVKLTKPASEQLVQELPGQTAWLICGPLRADYSRVPASLAPEPMVQELLPEATVIDAQQYIAPNLAILTHVRLPERPNTGTDAHLHGSGGAGATATAP